MFNIQATLVQIGDECTVTVSMPREQAEVLRMMRGTCSEPGCDAPIAGWCWTHRTMTKLCFGHLVEHFCGVLHRPDEDPCELLIHPEYLIG